MGKTERLRRIAVLTVTVSACAAVAGSAVAQSTWAVHLPADRLDEVRAVASTADDGAVAVGLGSSNAPGGQFDAVVVRTDATGELLWQTQIGTSGLDRLEGVAELADGDLLAVGMRDDGEVGNLSWAVRLNPGGGIVWDRTYGPPLHGILRGGAQLPGGDLAVWGTFDDDFGLARLAPDGTVVEVWRMGAPNADDQIIDAVPDGDGGWYFLGAVQSGTGLQPVIVRLGADGRVLWKRWQPEVGRPGSLSRASGGGVLVSGRLDRDDGLWLARLDADGGELWQRVYGGPGTDREGGLAVEMPDGGILAVGQTNGTGNGQFDVWVLRTDAAGQPLWQNAFGAAGSEIPLGAARTLEGGFVLAGKSTQAGSFNNDPWLVRLDHEGVIGGACTLVSTADRQLLAHELPPLRDDFPLEPGEPTGDARVELDGGLALKARGADLGVPLPESGVRGRLVLVNDGSDAPAEGCERLVNARDVVGAVAVIESGNVGGDFSALDGSDRCSYTTKLANVQAAGAVAAIVLNTDAEIDVLLPLNDDGNGDAISVHAVSVATPDVPEVLEALGDRVTLRPGLVWQGEAATAKSGGFERQLECADAKPLCDADGDGVMGPSDLAAVVAALFSDSASAQAAATAAQADCFRDDAGDALDLAVPLLGLGR